MPLAAGDRLGPYEIVAPLGAGGMGEVYRATDTRLGRLVAVKVLPETLSGDPQFRERFEREAKTISQLSHPHICVLHDVGRQDKTEYLVLEFLEGETLADRIARGLSIPEALRLAIQIAGALAFAHRAGVVHRDLKPGNVMLTKSGTGSTSAPQAKLLDFGLAKSAPAFAASSRLGNLTAPPTMTTPLTAQGSIIGTFQYMAPEQLEGGDADTRSDIFAFGALLYEMVTGRKAFSGKSQVSVMAAILDHDAPSASAVAPQVPAPLDRLIRKCLAKDPEARWQSARDIASELEWILETVGQPPSMSSSSPGATAARRIEPLGIGAAVILAAAAAATWLIVRPQPASPLRAVRVAADIGTDASLWYSNSGAAAALSPDGTLLAFVAQKNADARPQLFVRRLDQLQASPLSGTDNATSPFFSPDGQWIAFFAGTALKKISAAGGAAVTLCEVPTGRGGDWGDDGSIVYSPANNPGISLMRVSSNGGKPEPLIKLADGEVTQRFPQLLPGSKAVLFMGHTATGAYEDATIVIQSLPDGPRKNLVRGGYYPRYLKSGHIVYVHEGTLFALPFDVDRLEVTGPPVPAIEHISTGPGGGAQISVSSNGTAVYLAGESVTASPDITWLERDGKTSVLRPAQANWSNPAFSPDGRRIAFDVADGRQADIWTYDWERDTLTRSTFDVTDDEKPIWTPDGSRIAFSSKRGDKQSFNLYWQRADGTGDVQRLVEAKTQLYASSWHPSGKFLAFTELTSQNWDLKILPIEGDERSGWKPGTPTTFLATPFTEIEAMFSPDGRWIAYQSDETGRPEIYVRPFPGPGGKWQVSSDGASWPMWSRTSRQLFFGTLDGRLMVAAYSIEGDSFRVEKPRQWTTTRYRVRPRILPSQRSFALHPDGLRMALAQDMSGQFNAKNDKLVFIFNFFDELRRIAPAAKK